MRQNYYMSSKTFQNRPWSNVKLPLDSPGGSTLQWDARRDFLYMAPFLIMLGVQVPRLWAAGDIFPTYFGNIIQKKMLIYYIQWNIWPCRNDGAVHTNVGCINSLYFKGNYSAASNSTKLVHWPLMGGLLHLVQWGGNWAGCSPLSPLLTVPNVTAHPSAASVPITVLYCIVIPLWGRHHSRPP